MSHCLTTSIYIANQWILMSFTAPLNFHCICTVIVVFWQIWHWKLLYSLVAHIFHLKRYKHALYRCIKSICLYYYHGLWLILGFLVKHHPKTSLIIHSWCLLAGLKVSSKWSIMLSLSHYRILKILLLTDWLTPLAKHNLTTC